MSAALDLDLCDAAARPVNGGAEITALAGATSSREAGAVRELTSIIDRIDALARGTVDSLAGEELLEFSSLLAKAETKIGALRADALARVNETGDWQNAGARTVDEYERQVSKTSLADSRKSVKRAKALKNDLPTFKEDLSDGEISVAHVDVLTKVIQSPALKEQLLDPDDGEAQLREAAQTMDAGQFEKRVKAWAIKHAPKRSERMAREKSKEERLSIVEDSDGWIISGYLDPINGKIVDSTLTKVMGVPSLGDPRGPLSRRAAALAEICDRAAQDSDEAGKGNGGAHITVQVPLETLVTAEAAAKLEEEAAAAEREQGAAPVEHPVLGPVLAEIRAGIDPDLFTGLEPATLDDGTPLVPSDLMTLLCDSRISKQIFSRDGVILDHGQAHRLCTPQQRRAVIARDRTCRFPGCHHTYQSSQVHHAIHWKNGGNSDIDNLVMLCWHHHRFVHRNDITIFRHRDGWSFRDGNGWEYTAHGRRRIAPSSGSSGASRPSGSSGTSGPSGSSGTSVPSGPSEALATGAPVPGGQGAANSDRSSVPTADFPPTESFFNTDAEIPF